MSGDPHERERERSGFVPSADGGKHDRLTNGIAG